jgi:hypothetical protein
MPDEALSEAMNTYNPCLAVLVEKGFKVSGDLPEAGTARWLAENDRVRISASSPVSLLGLVALWETRGEGWRKKPEDPDYYDLILEGESIP